CTPSEIPTATASGLWLTRLGECTRISGDYSPGPGRLETPVHGRRDLAHALHQRGETFRFERLRAVGQGLLRTGVHLDDQPVGAGRDPGQRHRLDELPVAGPVARIDQDGQVREL